MRDSDQGEASRQAILAALKEQGGGTHKRELARMTGKGWGTIGHHVYVLAKAGIVETEVHGRKLWVFESRLARSERDWLLATRAAARRKILDFIRVQPKDINTLSAEMDLSKKVVRTHLQHLQRYGAIKATDGYPPKYVPAEQEPKTR